MPRAAARLLSVLLSALVALAVLAGPSAAADSADASVMATASAKKRAKKPARAKRPAVRPKRSACAIDRVKLPAKRAAKRSARRPSTRDAARSAAAKRRKRATRRAKPLACRVPARPPVTTKAKAPVIDAAPSAPAAPPVAPAPTAAHSLVPEGPDATAPVTPEFFGAVADAAFATRGRARATVLDAVTSSGARSLRQTFNWATIERTPGAWDWRALDQYVADTARRQIEVLPILFGAPDFAARTGPDATGSGFYPPADNARFADFAARAVGRYGHKGSFWRDHPSLPNRPITAWEVWNEPNGGEFWRTGVDPADYTRLLIAASAAIKAADPQAKVVSAGLPAMGGPVDSITPYLDGMYRAGAGPAMDAIGLHPYAPSPAKALEIIGEARAVTRTHADQAKPIWVTEYGYSTGGGASDYFQSEAGQAAMVTETARRVAAVRDRLGIGKLVYYSLSDLPVWPGGAEFWGLYCGLYRIDGSPKPAAAALGATVADLTATPRTAAPAAIPDLRDIVAGRVDNGGVVPY